MTVTFNRVANGEFQVLNNGDVTEHRIVNSSAGFSGSRNDYIIVVSGQVKQTGLSLAKAKKIVAFTFAKAAKEVTAQPTPAKVEQEIAPIGDEDDIGEWAGEWAGEWVAELPEVEGAILARIRANRK